jgi:hypothetical protein
MGVFGHLVWALGAAILDRMGFWALLLLPMVICPLWAIFGQHGRKARRALLEGATAPGDKPPGYPN